MRHMTGSVYAVFDKPVHLYRGTTMAGIIQDEAVHNPERGFVGGFEMETLSLGLPFMAAFLDPGSWGKEYAWWLDNYDKMAGMWLVGEDMPQANNAVTLHASEKDQYGLPVPDIHYDDHANDKAMRDHAFGRGEEVYKSAGAIKAFRTPPYPSTHNLGTNRMSEKPQDGVVDKNGRTHDVKNLFVSDGSQFTTGAAENPTLTHRVAGAAPGRPHFIGDGQGEPVTPPAALRSDSRRHAPPAVYFCAIRSSSVVEPTPMVARQLQARHRQDSPDVRNRRYFLPPQADCGWSPRAGHGQPSPSRPGRSAPLDHAGSANRPRPCAAQHHRSRDRRSADRQRGRAEPGSSSTASSTATRRSSASSRRRAIACARARTARSRCISTRISGRNACIGCAASSPSCCGTRRNRTLFAARDRFGIKPLFYAWHDGTLYLASEVKALFAAGVPARWDAESVYHAVEFGGHQMRTLFDGVFQVPPGHYLHRHRPALSAARATGISTIPTADDRVAQRSDADYAAEFRHVLEEAVRLRLRADVPVGCYLSGGLDSCSVLGLAARHHPRADPRLHADLRPRRVRRRAQARGDGGAGGRRVHPIPIRQDDLADHFADADAAVGDALLQRARRRQVSAEPRGARCRLQGRHDRRRIGRDPRRLRAFSPRHAAVQPRGPGSGRRSQALLEELERANRSPAACCCRMATAGPLDGVGGCSASCRHGSRRSRRGPQKMRAVAGRGLSRAGSAQRESLPRMLSDIDVRGQLAGPRAACTSRSISGRRPCCPATS